MINMRCLISSTSVQRHVYTAINTAITLDKSDVLRREWSDPEPAVGNAEECSTTEKVTEIFSA